MQIESIGEITNHMYSAVQGLRSAYLRLDNKYNGGMGRPESNVTRNKEQQAEESYHRTYKEVDIPHEIDFLV